MGAIASGGVCVLNPDVVSVLGSDADEAIESVMADETEELKSREKRYRDDRPFPDMRDRVVILVDDGLATGATMRRRARRSSARTEKNCCGRSRGGGNKLPGISR